MNRKNLLLLAVAVVSGGVFAGSAASKNENAAPPRIEGHGEVTRFPDAAQQPRDGSKIVVDLTKGGPDDQINAGLEKVARFVNIHSQAGKTPAHAQICVVLHGDATVLALNDETYGTLANRKNPNRPLMQKLCKAGVKFFVCGQALTHKGYHPEQTNEEATVAVSGLTALVNLQHDGYAYIPLLK